MIYRVIKRTIDIVLSLLVLILFCWLYGILALVIRLNLGSPVIFHQDRPGKNGKVFHMYKFRSMTDGRDENGELLSDEERLTSFGKRLRSTSLDELPEFINILKGDMSLIGPRPLLVRYLPFYTKEEFHRHDVRPGLTGLAQINGRNDLIWEERFRYDLEYVNHLSLGMDLKVVFQTVGKVLKRSGTLSGGAQTVADLDAYRRMQMERGEISPDELVGDCHE